jgi:hypothetical protein
MEVELSDFSSGSGNGQHDPEGHAQRIDLILIIKEYVTD